MPELIPFCFDEAVVRRDRPWFVSSDVCNVLASNHFIDALSCFDEDELTTPAELVVWALLLSGDVFEEVQKRVSIFQNHVPDVWGQFEERVSACHVIPPGSIKWIRYEPHFVDEQDIDQFVDSSRWGQQGGA